MSSKLGMAREYRNIFNNCVDDIYEYLGFIQAPSKSVEAESIKSYFDKLDEIKFKLDICEDERDFNKIVSLEALEDECGIWDR